MPFAITVQAGKLEFALCSSALFISVYSTDCRTPTSRHGPYRFQPQKQFLTRGTNILLFFCFSFALVLLDHVPTVLLSILLWKIQFCSLIQDVSPARCGGRCEHPRGGKEKKRKGMQELRGFFLKKLMVHQGECCF